MTHSQPLPLTSDFLSRSQAVASAFAESSPPDPATYADSYHDSMEESGSGSLGYYSDGDLADLGPNDPIDDLLLVESE